MPGIGQLFSLVAFPPLPPSPPQICELAKSFFCPNAAGAGSLSSSLGMKRLYLGWLILRGQGEEKRGAAVGIPLSAGPAVGRGRSLCKTLRCYCRGSEGEERLQSQVMP